MSLQIKVLGGNKGFLYMLSAVIPSIPFTRIDVATENNHLQIVA